MNPANSTHVQHKFWPMGRHNCKFSTHNSTQRVVSQLFIYHTVIFNTCTVYQLPSGSPSDIVVHQSRLRKFSSPA